MKKIIILFFLLIMVSKLYGFGYPSKYIEIDSLTSANETALVNLDLKNKELSLKYNDTTIVFHQTYKKSNGYFVSALLLDDLDNASLALEIEKLDKVTTDSVFVSAKIFKVDKKRELKEVEKIKSLGVAKLDLAGVCVSQSKKQRVKQALVIGGVGAVITTAAILVQTKKK